MQAALVNAVHVLNLSDAGTLLSLGPIPDDRFGTVSIWMQRFFSRYTLCHCKIGTLRSDDWVMQQSEGVLLLVITGDDSYGDDHEYVVVLYCASQATID